MVPPSSLRIPRAHRYSVYIRVFNFAYRTLTFFGWASHPILLCLVLLVAVQTPQSFLITVWPLSRSLAATCEISVDFFSSAYLDVSVRRVPLHNLFIQLWIRDLLSRGFPHSDTPGSKLICSSPGLFAAYRVLHRLLMPRHSPCALCSLTFFVSFFLFVLVLNLLNRKTISIDKS